MREKRCSRIAAFPIGEGGPRQRWIGCSHKLRTCDDLPRSLSCRQNPIRLAPLATFPSRGRLCVGDTAFPIQPPPLRGTSFHRKEGVSTRAPSFGRGCRAQRGGVGFLFGRRSRLLFAFPMQGKRCYPCAILHKQHCPYEGNQRGAGSILRLFDCHAFSGGNPLHPLSNVLPHRRRGQDRPARGIPLCGCSL